MKPKSYIEGMGIKQVSACEAIRYVYDILLNIDEYLSCNHKNYIGAGSLYHQEIQIALRKAGAKRIKEDK
jgi:hypothetical protein